MRNFRYAEKQDTVQSLLEGLNLSQQQAVRHVDGPLLVLAGPGSGKTRVVTHRIAWLVHQGIAGRQILALTFTNKAADEMRARVEALAPHEHVWLGTFHGFAARLLRRYASLCGLSPNYTIYDADDSRRALRATVDRMKLDLMHYNVGQVAQAISWAKNNLITPSEYVPRPGSTLGLLVEKVYPRYQETLRQSNAADFDDLLLHVALLLREQGEVRAELDEQYRYVLVDEYQDTNLAQYAIARALSIDNPHLAVTGDPDQSIYGWRGANLQNILSFEDDFPEVRVVRLEQNYRSTQRILAVASRLIAHNVRRKAKELFSENAEGPAVRLAQYADNEEEACEIARRIAETIRAGRRRPRDFAVFYRTNALSRVFEHALREYGVPFQLVHALEFYQRREIKDLRSYLQLLNNPSDDLAFRRVINTPRRGIGRTTVDRLDAFAVQTGVSLLEAAFRCHEIDALSKRSQKQVCQFSQLFGLLQEALGHSVEEILGLVLTETDYARSLEESESEEDLERLANVQELLTVARQFDERYVGTSALEGFLEETALAGDTDAFESESDCVTLMTLHASKGLEFPVVFITAVEEGLLPHERSKDKEDQLEEERRLLFVGVTRAKEELQISKAAYRDFRGQRRLTVPSRFLMELPREEMETVDSDPYAHELGTDDLPEMDRGGDSARNLTRFDADASWESDEPTRPVRRPRKPRRHAPPGGIPGIRTAASMAGETASSLDPDQFRQGMIVMHPEHGVGTVAAMTGDGDERTATVDFRATVGRVKVLLSDGSLTPLR